MSKPTLLYLAPQNPHPPTDGGKISIFYPLLYFSKSFKLFFIFPVSEKNANLEQIKRFYKEKYDIDAYPFYQDTKNDIKYLLMNPFKKEPFKWDKYYNQKVQNMINHIVKENNIKYIWVSSPHMAKYALIAKKQFRNLRLFLREHNIEYKLVEQFLHLTGNPIYKVIAYWQWKKTKTLEKKYWEYFDKVFFISDADYEIAMSESIYLRHKFIVLYDGYELVTEKAVIPENSDFILTVNFKSIQNVMSFKHFIEHIWKPNISRLKAMDIKLFITGVSEREISKIIRPFSLESLNIVSLGFVDNIDEVILKFKYVLSPTYMGSGIRLKLLNGMACGKPVFVTPLDISTCKVFKDMSNVVLFSNAENFMEKLLLLEKDTNLYINICREAIRTISDIFNWEYYYKKASEIILEAG